MKEQASSFSLLDFLSSYAEISAIPSLSGGGSCPKD
jgi:hypothetical protein